MAINKQIDRQLFIKSTTATAQPRVGFIGFGEVTYHFLHGLFQEKVEGFQIYSRPGSDQEKIEYLHKRAKKIGANLTFSLQELITNSDIIISSVRGDISFEVTKQAAQFLKSGQIFADLNNAIPSVKKASSNIINAKGAKFVDIALLELPIQVKHKSLMYVSGDGALDFKQIMDQYNMNIEYINDQPGSAAMIKALVNIFMKGLQGVYLEFIISAQKAGVSLDLLEPLLVKPVLDLPREKDLAFWFIRGSLLASRKTNEMKEALKMMHELGVDPIILEATIERLSRVARFNLNRYFDATHDVAEYQDIIAKLFQISKEENIAVR